MMKIDFTQFGWAVLGITAVVQCHRLSIQKSETLKGESGLRKVKKQQAEGTSRPIEHEQVFPDSCHPHSADWGGVEAVTRARHELVVVVVSIA